MNNKILYRSISAIITSAIMWFFGILGLLMFKEFTNENRLYINIVCVIVLFTQLYYITIRPVVLAKTFFVDINEDRIEYSKGVIFKSSVIIPIKRVQYIEKSSNVLGNKFDLLGIKIYTSSSSHQIGCLSPDENSSLSESIARFIKEKSDDNHGK